MTRRRPDWRALRRAERSGGLEARRYARAQRARQERAYRGGDAEQGTHAPRVRHDAAQQVPLETCGRGARHTLLDERAADIEQSPVAHPGGTGTLAGATGETAIQVQLRAGRHRLALEQLLHEIDATPRTVELVPEQLIGRTGRQAEPTVHAAAQDGVGFTAGGRAPDEIGERGLHNLPMP